MDGVHAVLENPLGQQLAGLGCGCTAGAAHWWFSHLETVSSAAHPRITIDCQICHGQPVVRGLRYPVWVVLEYLASGMMEVEILADYPDLEAEDFQACQAYAASLLKKMGRIFETSGLTEEEIAAGKTPRQAVTKQALLAHLIETGKVPPGTVLDEHGQLP
ncbi:DUF433 domain-containing protein [Hymenobacter antarcticus]|uniref:DUF433 domain-containing protein n=1 Tax=Hymenobacter antarcticus TaxID=486270 RepID=UPI0031EF72C1